MAEKDTNTDYNSDETSHLEGDNSENNGDKESLVEELKGLFSMNILMGLNPLLLYKLYWYKNDFTGNGGVKDQWHAEDISS